MSQKDTIVEIKAKVPVMIHPTCTKSQWDTAQRCNIALHDELRKLILACYEGMKPDLAAPWNRKSPS